MLGYIQAQIIMAREMAAFYIIQLNAHFADIFLLLSAVWSLDFLPVTIFIPPFCINHKLWDFDMLLLNFISVLSPLFLLVVTYVFISKDKE